MEERKGKGGGRRKREIYGEEEKKGEKRTSCTAHGKGGRGKGEKAFVSTARGETQERGKKKRKRVCFRLLLLLHNHKISG